MGRVMGMKTDRRNKWHIQRLSGSGSTLEREFDLLQVKTQYCKQHCGEMSPTTLHLVPRTVPGTNGHEINLCWMDKWVSDLEWSHFIWIWWNSLVSRISIRLPGITAPLRISQCWRNSSGQFVPEDSNLKCLFLYVFFLSLTKIIFNP